MYQLTFKDKTFLKGSSGITILNIFDLNKGGGGQKSKDKRTRDMR